ncbi:pantoate--beta-alanine ligase [Kaarinaea lacus]
MLVIELIQSLREQLQSWRQLGQSIAFVPTMGNLHQGHFRLVDVAKQQADKVVVSIFVNPLQFAPGTDYEAYPRTLQQDREQLEKLKVDLLFCPPVSAIYPEGMDEATKVVVPGLSDILCGAYRPGHFAGVTTVVAKLFNLVQPDIVVFGEKDYQQLLIIRRMTNDLCFPPKIMGVETVRESNGLAMSSRNQYLSNKERNDAALLYNTLIDVAARVKERIVQGDTVYGDFQDIEQRANQQLHAQGFRPEYLKVCYADDLSDARLPHDASRAMRVLVAAWLGKARLIDNVPITLA